MSIQKDPERMETKYLHKFTDFTLRHSFASQGGAGKRVLEIGCGDGRLTWQYAKSARLVAGIDLEADDLRAAMINASSNRFMLYSRAEYSGRLIP